MFENIAGDYAKIGIGLLVSALFIQTVSMSYGMSKQYQERQLENQVVISEIKEHRNNLFYANTHVYQQDVVSLILRYKGDRRVLVKLKNGNTYEWSKDYHSTNYKVSSVSSVLPKDVLYDADLIYGPNKYDVIGYQFVEHQDGCGR